MQIKTGDRIHGWTRGVLAILFTLLSGNPLAATLYGVRSQELCDGGCGGLVGSAGLGDRLGATVVSGDFNGDGWSDLAAFDGESTVGLASAGAFHVIYGSSAGLSGADDQLWLEFSFDLPILDRQEGARFGSALAVGDFDGDSFDDLAVGVPLRNIEGTSGAGWVVVIYGSSVGLQTDSGTPPRRFQLGSGGVGGGPRGAGDIMGWALAAGDFDGSGIDDLAVGIPGDRVNGFDDAGSILVLYGLGSGLSSTNHQFFDQDSSDGSGAMAGVAEAGDSFGYALAAGDFNDDGADDLAIGAPVETQDAFPGTHHGAFHVLYGSSIVGLRLAGNQLWTQLNVDTGGSLEQDDLFGFVLAAGDLTGDGSDDLVIGTPFEDDEAVGTLADVGEITVLYGAVETGLSTFLSQSYFESDVLPGSAVAPGDGFGFALALGNFLDRTAPPADPAGKLDLAIGSPWDNVWNGVQQQNDAGSVIVTRHDLFNLNSGQARRWAQGYGGSAGALIPDQWYGSALAAGDFDGDGHGDLAIGASGFDPGDGLDQGAIYTLYGALFSDGFESEDTAFWTETAP